MVALGGGLGLIYGIPVRFDWNVAYESRHAVFGPDKAGAPWQSVEATKRKATRVRSSQSGSCSEPCHCWPKMAVMAGHRVLSTASRPELVAKVGGAYPRGVRD